uniref:Uncharacterized protein n=1 Tax=Anguilla anguilla TaxID=7936 RepID=A0A0E9U919_ANGAN
MKTSRPCVFSRSRVGG